MVGPNRPIGFKPESPMVSFNNQQPVNYLTRHQMNLDSTPPTPTPQTIANHHFNFLQQQSPPLAMSSNQLSRAGNSRALSLLSSSPPAHQTTTIIPPVPSIGQYGFAQVMHNESMISESTSTTHQFQGMFNNDHGDSSSSGIKQQTLSFRWD